jgi:hypothetical protein
MKELLAQAAELENITIQNTHNDVDILIEIFNKLWIVNQLKINNPFH